MKIEQSVLDFDLNKSQIDYYKALENLKEESRNIKANHHLLFVLNTINNVNEIIKESPENFKNFSVYIFKQNGITDVTIVNNLNGTLVNSNSNEALMEIIHQLERSHINTHEFCGILNQSSQSNPILINLSEELGVLEKVFLTEEILSTFKYQQMNLAIPTNMIKDKKVKV